ncbi:MAG: SDR family oxidoreductase [Acidimicrobiales bacterium]|jgi:thioester reductase-like protein|nr:SDR family oxidoreductase [Acidimicrobiales bacterium]
MATVLFTGFPGFLGVQLLPRVLRRAPEHRAVCVVQARFADLARRRVTQLETADPSLAGRIELVEGDITVAGLGLQDPVALARDLHQVWHLAAVYDLGVPRAVGVRVNVDGTRHVLDLAEQATALDRFQYVSTCYVSGRWAGVFRESDLDVGQRFNNFYEETKFLAEVLVQQARDGGLPTSVYRPAIVAGDAGTGETQKYDGPYFALQWLLRQPRLAVMPVIGDPTAFRMNVVPRDFVVDAIAALSGEPWSAGRVYQLADPRPLTIDELLTAMAGATGRRMIRVPLPRRLAMFALDHVPGVEALLRIPSSAVPYFTHPTYYDTTRTEADLEGTEVACPALTDYLPRLVSFMQAHPEVSAHAMV